MSRTLRSLALLAPITILACRDGSRAHREQAWRDPSPHRTGSVVVNGGRLQYLDWGGHGPPLVLLHGWGSNAHTFDDLAPRLTAEHRVLAITLRGFGQSDAPPPDYSLDQFADDLVATLDSLRLPSAIVAAHSFGGWILTRTALRHPTRIARLIYLDAAFDLRAADSIVARRPLTRPALPAAPSREQVMRWLADNFFGRWTLALEAEYRARSTDEDRRAQLLQPAVNEAKAAPAGWAQLTMPALAICALADVQSEFPWLQATDSSYRIAQRYVDTERRPFQHRECERFRQSGPTHRTVELPGHHYVFIWHPAEVAAAIRQFAAGP